MKNETFEQTKKQFFPFMLKMSKPWRRSFNKYEIDHICDIALWKSIERHQGDRAAFITYLGHMIRWEFLNTMRHEASKIKMVSLSRFHFKSGDEFLPEELTFKEEHDIIAEEEVGHVMSFLSSRQKEILNLFKDGVERKTIAKSMNITPERVRQIYESAKNKFDIITRSRNAKR